MTLSRFSGPWLLALQWNDDTAILCHNDKRIVQRYWDVHKKIKPGYNGTVYVYLKGYFQQVIVSEIMNKNVSDITEFIWHSTLYLTILYY